MISSQTYVQDPVPVMGKFGTVYARPGHRVLIDPKGNMIVRPTPLDLKLAQACKSFTSQPHPDSWRSAPAVELSRMFANTAGSAGGLVCLLKPAFCNEGCAA